EVLARHSIEIDQRLLVALHAHANPALDQLALLVSLLGSQALAVLLVVSLGCLIRKRRYGAAASLLIAVVGAQLLNDLLKLLFRRPRPVSVVTVLPGQEWSFPSGHAMVSLAFYGFLAFL